MDDSVPDFIGVHARVFDWHAEASPALGMQRLGLT